MISSGQVGFGTASPAVSLHAANGNTPTLRLEQNGTSGFTPQTWDVAGNETNFFIRDATNGSTLPFRINPSSATSSLYIKPAEIALNDGGGNQDVRIEGDTEQNLFFTDASTDSVGIGTNTPNATETFSRFTVQGNDPTGNTYSSVISTGSGEAAFVLSRTGSVPARWLNYIRSGKTDLRWLANGNNQMILDTSGNLFVTAVNPSSRELKRDIQQLDGDAAVSALEKLEPVEYFYKADADNEHHVGFIAEDVPELVATKSHKAVDSMEIVAVVTKVVKGQQATIQQQRGVMENQQKSINELNERLNKLERQLQSQD